MMNTWLSGRWLPIWRRNIRVWRKLSGPALVGNFGEPLLYLLALGYGFGAFVGELDGMSYLSFLATGMVLASAMNTATFEGCYSAFTRMDPQRTWEGMLATPLSLEDIVIGEIVWAATKSLISALAIVIVALLMGLFDWRTALAALPLAFMLGLCFGALALLITAFARGYDFFVYYFTLVLTPLFLLSGVFFPLDKMPAALRAAVELFPLRHAVVLLRGIMQHTATLSDWLWGLLLPLVYLAIATFIAVRILRRRLLA